MYLSVAFQEEEDEEEDESWWPVEATKVMTTSVSWQEILRDLLATRRSHEKWVTVQVLWIVRLKPASAHKRPILSFKRAPFNSSAEATVVLSAVG